MLTIKIGAQVQHAQHPSKTYTIAGIKSPTQVLLKHEDEYMLSSVRQLHAVKVQEKDVRTMNDYERFVWERREDVEKQVIDEMMAK
ncbi:hypothetical protein THOM_0471 [Trachipleistophora hominis]|uniref:Uncharacterized protein n=1 Tax=Trachipleistophora hominis TaxID=72359 RepID=L7JYK3_TRAHO|nr:hypothetical protein THOM_0471 [Trachipleistophora hominis]